MSRGRYHQYESVTATGEQWLGDVPSSWGAVRLKTLFRIRKQIAGKLGFDVLSVTQRGVKLKDLISGAGQLSMDYSKYQIVDEGDFVMNHMDLLTGFVDISSFPGVTSPDYRVFIPRTRSEMHSRFYLYIFQMCYLNKIFFPLGQGSAQLGRWRLPRQEFEEFVLPLPPLEEQCQIARFLDYETAKIDALIEKQQQLIALLKEKRQAVISHAVTKGLDPQAQLKDSGVEWLGKVPTHWEVLPLRRLVSNIEQGSSPQAANAPPNEGEFGVLKLSAIKKGTFLEGEAKTLDTETPFEEAFRVKAGDLLVTRGNTPDLVADACVVRDEPVRPIMMSDLVYRLNVNARTTADYLCLWLLSSLGRLQIKNDARGSSMTMAKVSQGHIRGWLATVPSIDEQTRIVEVVQNLSSKIQTLVEICQSQVNLLQERRTALISAAVTGKIDVRTWQLPEGAATQQIA